MSKDIKYALILLILVLILAISAMLFIDVKALTAKFTVTLSQNGQNNFAVLVLGEAGLGGGGQWSKLPT